MSFILKSEYQPAGDQPTAIAALTRGLTEGRRFQTLEGVTGSGKTFTMAHTIAAWDKPALVVSHNKTLAAQLFAELKEYFPQNAVEYFVSYYDYYQPEAYIPQTDTYIEKDSAINEEIERLRLSATHSLMNREDVIIVASVSCIYGLGSPEDYREMLIRLQRNDTIDRETLMRQLVDIQYTRNDYEPQPGAFRVRGDTLDVFPAYARHGIRIGFFGDTIDQLQRIDALTGKPEADLPRAAISPARHFVMPATRITPALAAIRAELAERLKWFEQNNKLLEAQRLAMRTNYDLEMLAETGYCSGVENYSRHLSGRGAGEPPATLLDYFPGEFLTIVDESHVTLPQVRGMYNGDQARKQTLVEHGFRLPSAKDNRPLNFDEFLQATGRMIFASATPADYERKVSPPPVQQVIRPTGLLDPVCELRPLTGQIDEVMEEIKARAARHERVLVTTLTKKTAEDLSAYLREAGLRVNYLHSEIDALERVELLRSLRLGDFDCLVGINLLREGLDLPEVSLVAILDADKEGFLRSESSLIQTAGRAARHSDGKVILFADKVTDSMRRALKLMTDRRERQTEYNREHGITPRTIIKKIQEGLQRKTAGQAVERHALARESAADYDVQTAISEMEAEMLAAADALEFERAAILRDQIAELRNAADLSGPEDSRSAKTRPTKRRKSGGLRYPGTRTVKARHHRRAKG
ncbi:MAG: excinuclease ABC subunit UvrB [Kiritimatiellia bacterium]|nr:excinuclease ABC subunit UvrB [Lentisphaerota bacterium]